MLWQLNLMRLLGNIIYFIFGGFVCTLAFVLIGCLLCVTIIGIPLGLQCFKCAELSLAPFGKEVTLNFSEHPIVNFLWVVFVGWWMFVATVAAGLILCVTIIGIPFGLQAFKFAKLSFAPFGATVN